MSAVIEAPVARSVSVERRPGHIPASAGALAAWIALVWLTHVWGERLVHTDRRARIFAAPLAGRFDLRFGGWRVVPVLVLAVAAVSFGPRLARRLRWRGLLFGGFLLAGAWALALAFVDGGPALTAPLTSRWDYLVDLPRIGSLRTFLGGFASNLGQYSTHVRAHPPGMLLLLRALQAFGLKGVGPEAVMVIAAGAAVVPAAMLALREVAGERAARNAWPFLAIAPSALWIATSADALFAGVAAWGVALTILAAGRTDRRGGTGRTDRSAWRGDALAATGGLLLGAAAFLSYGLVLVWLIPATVAFRRGTFRPLAIAATAAGAEALAFGAAGFWWTAGLAATHVEYLGGAARVRPQHYFWVGNLGAFALALGPAIAVAVARLRNAPVWLLVGAALAVVAIADASGLSKGEVERIWLPFVPWMLVAAACFDRTRESRGWLGVQAAVAIALQLAVRSPW